jgi:hypothetical protein
MGFELARDFIARCTRSSEGLARSAIGELGKIAHANALDLVGCGITTASGRPLPDLRSILASHSLIHAAEGEFYRDVLARAATRAEIAVSRVKEREVADWTQARFGLSDTALKARLADYGKSLGPPWTADEKMATMAAWLALAT